MTHHLVTLNYGPAGFRPDADMLTVSSGDTISFQLGDGPAQQPVQVITMSAPGEFLACPGGGNSRTRITVIKAVEDDPTDASCLTHRISAVEPGRSGGRRRSPGRWSPAGRRAGLQSKRQNVALAKPGR